jgi:hypothetical protein
MKMQEVKEKAQSLGIEPGKVRKADLIRLIQAAEGYQSCYGTTEGSCVYTNCCFRDDCLKLKS